jgi:Uma2 family endonuclease
MATIATRIGMPLDEFLEQYHEKPFELINGEKHFRMVTVAGHSSTIRLLFRLLDAFALANGGEVYPETTFIMPDGYDSNWVTGSREPDVMYYAGTRIADYKAATPEWRERPFPLVPDLVIEVVSPNDKVEELDKKIDAYLADGVRLIWVLKPQRRSAVVYAPDLEQPQFLEGDALLDGGDVLPGFKIALSKVFE